MVTLKALKEEFTKLTGLPAKKAMVEVACVGAGFRKMFSKVDWQWAVGAIAPRFLVEQSDEVEELKAKCEELSAQNAALLEELSHRPAEVSEVTCVEETAFTMPETEAHKLFRFLLLFNDGDHKSAYRRIQRRIHPDVNPHRVQLATSLTVTLNNIYAQMKEDIDEAGEQYDYQDSDADEFMQL